MKIKEFDWKSQKNSRIVIYGTTVGGKVVFQCLQALGIKPLFFCDRSQKYEQFCGIPVESPSILLNSNDYTVLNPLTRSFASVCQYMEQIGYKEIYCCNNLIADKKAKDFVYEENEKELVADFLQKYPIYSTTTEDTIILPSLEVFITEKCTLRCRDCSHLIPRYQAPKDYDIQEIIKHLSNVLTTVSYILDLIILGGEPLLHKKLFELIHWASQQEKIGTVTIISNGSIMPDEKTLSALEEGGGRIRISNYGKYSIKLNEISNVCAQRGIKCFVNNELWTDMGKIYNHNYSEKDLKEIFNDCPFSFSLLLLKGKVFRCAHVAHLNNLHVLDSITHDSVSFEDMSNTDISAKKRELQSYLKIDYLIGCQYCNGIKNSISGIEPGIQGIR